MIGIRLLGPADCPAVAHLHQQYLRTNFSGWPGEKLLTTYYQAMVSQEGAVGYVAVSTGEQLMGYVCGVWDSRRLRRRLLRWHALPLAVFGLMQVGRRPQFLLSVKNRWRNATVVTPKEGDGYELRPIVVAETARGSGTAEALVQMLRQDARKRGFTQVHLYTEPDNLAARKFYEKIGFANAAPVERNGLLSMLRYVISAET